ncbi:hypothetical protein ACNGI9_07725 [Campylobacter jejuni]
MAIAIKGITCKITAIITAIKNSRKCKNYLPNLQGVGTSKTQLQLNTQHQQGNFLSIHCLSFDIGNVICNA